MSKWWKSKKSKTGPMNIPNDPNKKTRSLVSFFLDQQKPSTDLNIKTDSTFPIHPSIDIDSSQQRRTNQSILKSPTYHDAQIKTKSNSIFDHHLQLFDELINENNSCFGFSLSHITSKYCLYMTIIIFLGICLIISLTAILKK